jgi:hypothetical protein
LALRVAPELSAVPGVREACVLAANEAFIVIILTSLVS